MASRWFTLRFNRKNVLAIWPDPFDQVDHRQSAGKQPADPAAEAQSPQRRAHDKRKTQERNEEWQGEIDKLAKKHPDKNHSALCGMLARDTGEEMQTIRRVTKRPQT